jgi:hypothetical protein
MGKYKSTTNDERKAKIQRQKTQVAALPDDIRSSLATCASEMSTDPKYRDRGPAAKLQLFLNATTVTAQQAALKMLAKALGTAQPTPDTPQLQQLLAGLTYTLFDAACWELSSGIVRVMDALTQSNFGTDSTVLESPFRDFLQRACATPRFAHVPVISALVTMPSGLKPDAGVEHLFRCCWAMQLRIASALVELYIDCQTSMAWPDGFAQCECDRYLLDMIKTVTMILQFSGQEIQNAMRDQIDSDAISNYVSCLNHLLCSPDLVRECAMSAGASWVKLLSLGGPVDEISRLFSVAIMHADATTELQPWIFTVVQKKSFVSVYRELPTFSQLSIVRGLLSTVPLVDLCNVQADAMVDCLHDQIFDVLTSFCNDSADHHMRFQAMSALHICLQQTIKRCSSGAVSRALMASKQDQVLHVIWNSLEDPSSGIVSQTQALFDYLLAVREVSVDDAESFWQELTRKFLNLDWNRKGKYAPLAAITSRLGADFVMQIHSDVFHDVVLALSYESVASAAASLFEALLKSLLHSGVDGHLACLASCLPSLLNALCSPDPIIQASVLSYAIPLVLKCIPDCLDTILAAIRTADADSHSKLWALVAVFRVARASGKVRDLVFTREHDAACVENGSGTITYAEMCTALTNEDGEMRLATLELLCVCYKTTLELTPDEFSLLKVAIPLTLALDSTSLRSRCRSLMGKLFVRLHQSARQSVVQSKSSANETDTVTRMKNFLRWLVELIRNSVCPGVSFERKAMALEFWSELTRLYFEPPRAQVDKQSKLWHAAHDFQLDFVFTLPNTLVLINAVSDSWDRNRIKAYEILQAIPGKSLPGFETDSQIASLVKCGKFLIASRRERECDAGALLLKLVFHRYISCGWVIALRDAVVTVPPVDLATESSMAFLLDLVTLLRDEISPVARDGSEQPRLSSLVHGLLLTLRYCVDCVNFTRQTSGNELAAFKKLVSSILEIAQSVAESALTAIGSSTAYGSGCLPADSAGRVGFDDVGVNIGEDTQTEQTLVVGSWHSCKEMSTLIGTLARNIPIPKDDANSILTFSQVIYMGEILMNVLLSTRHNGAIEKSFVAFQTLCKRVSHSSAPQVTQLCSQWLDKLLSNVLVEDEYTLRRSAGIPFCILAILYTEAGTSQRPLLQLTMDTLLSVAGGVDASTSARVHSLNILRSLFKDTYLSLDVMSYIAPAFIASINGTESKHWGVTNSSSLLFAALIARALGSQRVNDKSARSGVTAAEFFSRFPDLYEFLIQILGRAEFVETTDSCTDPSSSSTVGVEPGVFYALLLTSKLLPSMVSSSHGKKDLAAFVPLVRRFGAHKNYRCRCAAALALTSLVAEPFAREQISAVVTQLKGCIHQNYIHGSVVQVQCLLQLFSTDVWKKNIPTWTSCLALLVAPRFSCMVRHAVLDLMMDAVATLKEAKRGVYDEAYIFVNTAVRVEVSSCIQEVVDRLSLCGDHSSIGHKRMRMRAAEVWERTALVLHRLDASSRDREHNTVTVMALLKDPSCTIQVVGLKMLKRLLRAGLHDWFDIDLLTKKVLQRGSRKIPVFVLRELCSVMLHLRYTMPEIVRVHFWADSWDHDPQSQDVYQMWSSIVDALVTDVPGLGQCMRFMGMIISQAHTSADTSDVAQDARLVKRLEPWVTSMVASADASQLSNVRGACVDSLTRARVLLNLSNLHGRDYSSSWSRMVVLLWGVIIQLSHDEVEDIRIAAASLAHSFLQPAGAQIERPIASAVCESCIQHLCSSLLIENVSEGCLEYFCNVVEGGHSHNNVLQDDRSTLFEKEEDNQYFEELLSIRWYAAAVHRWCKSVVGSMDDTDIAQQQATQLSVGRAHGSVSSMLTSLGGVCRLAVISASIFGLSGFSNRPDIFVGLYRLSLGLVAFAPLRRLPSTDVVLENLGMEIMQETMQSLRQLCVDMSCNPLLRDAMVAAADAWETANFQSENAAVLSL